MPVRIGAAGAKPTPVAVGVRTNSPEVAAIVAGTPAGRLPAKPLTAPKALVAVTVPSRKLPKGVVAERALNAPAAVVSPCCHGAGARALLSPSAEKGRLRA